MDFSLTEDQQRIREAVLGYCTRFPDEYWLERDHEGAFPHDFHKAMAESGWLGVAMPEAVGGAGLGITEAAIMMQAVAESGGGMTAASSIHGPVFSMQPVALFGTEEQRQRMIPPVLSGEDLICFAVTEPNAGLDTTKLTTRAERRDGGYLVNGEKIWISVAQAASKMMLLARTTPLDEVKRKTEGLSLFFTDLDRARIEVREIHAGNPHPPDRPGKPSYDPELPGREGARPAQVVLTPNWPGPPMASRSGVSDRCRAGLCSPRGAGRGSLWPSPVPPGPCRGALSRQPGRVY